MNSNQIYPKTQNGPNPPVDGEPAPKGPCHKNNSKNCKNCHSEKIFFFKSCQEKFRDDRPNFKKPKYKEKSQRTFLYTPPPLPWLRNSLEEPTPELTPKFDKIPNMEQAYMTISYP